MGFERWAWLLVHYALPVVGCLACVAMLLAFVYALAIIDKTLWRLL